jgi:hypothetical protein
LKAAGPLLLLLLDAGAAAGMVGAASEDVTGSASVELHRDGSPIVWVSCDVLCGCVCWLFRECGDQAHPFETAEASNNV